MKTALGLRSGISMALALALAASPGPTIRPTPAREPRPSFRYLEPRSQRQTQREKDSKRRLNARNAEYNRAKLQRRDIDPAQPIIAKMTNWQRTHYSRELAKSASHRPDLALANKWLATSRHA